MKSIPPSIQRLIREFNKLPGIGAKTSERFVFHLLRQPQSEIDALAQSLLAVKKNIHTCVDCFTVCEEERCSICTDSQRDRSTLCVVAEARDVMAMEDTAEYRGLYHVLGGVISPADGIGPDQLHLKELAERAQQLQVKEVIIATNPDMEGETTATYVAQQLAPLHITITKIARGLPVGGNIEFADSVTLTTALRGRQKME